jgi:hypothetical protein
MPQRACYGLLDGGPSHSGPLLGPFESLRGGTLSTNPRQQPPSAWQVRRCWVIWIFLVCDKFAEYLVSENQVLWHEIAEFFFTELIE